MSTFISSRSNLPNTVNKIFATKAISIFRRITIMHISTCAVHIGIGNRHKPTLYYC